MSRRKNHGKRRISKLAFFLIGISLFVLFIFPYFGNYLRSIISMGLNPLQSIGSTLTWVGMLVVVIGVGTMFSSPDKSFGSKRSTKFLFIGIILVVIGMFLENSLSLFSEGGAGIGYH